MTKDHSKQDRQNRQGHLVYVSRDGTVITTRTADAAPDMLEALRRLVKMIDDDQVPLSADALYAALADARAAIRKATGETQ